MQFFKNKLRINKLTIISALMFFMAVFLWGNLVFAQVDVGMEYGAQIGLSNTDPRIIIARVIQVALGFLGIIAVGLILYAGWLWMSSAGSEDKIEQAKNILKNAVIGLIIILSSFAIATFILNKFMGAVNGNGSYNPDGAGGGGTGGGIGVLGSCTVESVYPEPSQQEVPRNTSIIMTFREEVNSETICEDTNANAIFCDSGDYIKTDGRIKIYKNNEEANFIKLIKAATTDNKTFIFSPDAYLGSPSESIWYTVYLSDAIQKTNGDSVFKTCSKDYLDWNFEVSNKLDFDPPQVKAGGIFPLPGSTNPTNSVIQINFNEAVNPIMVSGSADDVKDYIKIVNVADPSNYLKGRFVVSNQYKTVEFLSDNQCGVNGCGEKIYCLPASSQLRVELKAAALAGCVDCNTHSPYNICSESHCQDSDGKNYPTVQILNGIVDVASNSLDGNRANGAEGPATYYNENSPAEGMGDNYQWSFSTSGGADTSSPVIESISPDFGTSGTSLSNPIIITFNKLMMSSSLRTGEININNSAGSVTHKRINLISAKPLDVTKPELELPGYFIGKSDVDSNSDGIADKTVAEIRHGIFGDLVKYRAQVGSGVKDNLQNCFKPSSGPSCTADASSPSCCNGVKTVGDQCPD
ncbi:MAG: Ig-like domain-containing protein [Patescibacteria group bacterium]|jgi:hypothetical protein